VKDLTQILPQFLIHRFASILGNKYHMYLPIRETLHLGKHVQQGLGVSQEVEKMLGRNELHLANKYQ
jgi:hypothetical protein